MKNDFISLIKTIEPKEQEAFHHYLQCCYGNQKAVLQEYEKLMQLIAHGEEISDILGSFDAKSRKNTLNAYSDLKKWFLEFLALQEIRSGSTESKFLTLEALRKRRLHEVFQQHSNRLMQDLDKQTSPDMWQLFWKARLSHITYFNIPIDKLQDYQTAMLQLLYNFDSFYIAGKLKYAAELYSRSIIVQEAYNPVLLDNILILVEKDIAIHPLVKRIYLPMLNMIKDQSDIAYLTLKNYLKQANEHDPIERQAILFYLLNFIIHRLRIHKDDETLVKECFDLYRLGIDEALYTVTGYFPVETFLNIVNIGCHLKQYDWLKKFVDEWSLTLIPIEKNPTQSMALARIYFEEKQYDKVKDLLQNVVFKNMLIKLNAKLLLIRAYYENKDEISLMLHSNHALYLYIYRNNSIGIALKTSVINFVKIFKQLVNRKPKKQLLKELNDKEKSVICYDWLKAKIDERSLIVRR